VETDRNGSARDGDGPVFRDGDSTAADLGTVTGCAPAGSASIAFSGSAPSRSTISSRCRPRAA